MPDPDVATATEPEKSEAVESGESEESVAAAVAEAEKAAEAFFPAETEEAAESTIAQAEVTPAEGAEAAAETKPDETPAQPHISPEWAAAAKGMWFTDDEIAAFKDDREAEFHVQSRRFQGLQRAGIDPRELIAFRNAQRRSQQKSDARQQPGAEQPTGQSEATARASAPTGLADFKLPEINDEDIAPELAESLRATEQYVNQLKENLGAENARLRQEVADLQSAVQQRAEQNVAADNEAKYAAQWDAAAKAIPEFLAEFGMPSEVQRLPPDDARVLKIKSFDPYVQATWHRHALAMGGDQNVNLQSVVADAFKQFVTNRAAAKANANGTPTTQAAQPGSVVRSAPRRAPSQAKGDDSAQDINAALEETMRAVSAAWDNANGNPFAMPAG